MDPAALSRSRPSAPPHLAWPSDRAPKSSPKPASQGLEEFDACKYTTVRHLRVWLCSSTPAGPLHLYKRMLA